MTKNRQQKTGESNASREFPIRMSIELANYYTRCEATLKRIATMAASEHRYDGAKGAAHMQQIASDALATVPPAIIRIPAAALKASESLRRDVLSRRSTIIINKRTTNDIYRDIEGAKDAIARSLWMSKHEGFGAVTLKNMRAERKALRDEIVSLRAEWDAAYNNEAQAVKEAK